MKLGKGLLNILEKTAEVAEFTGKISGNPLLVLGGKVVQEVVQSDDDTADFLRQLDDAELDNLIEAANREKYRR